MDLRGAEDLAAVGDELGGHAPDARRGVRGRGGGHKDLLEEGDDRDGREDRVQDEDALADVQETAPGGPPSGQRLRGRALCGAQSPRRMFRAPPRIAERGRAVLGGACARLCLHTRKLMGVEP